MTCTVSMWTHVDDQQWTFPHFCMSFSGSQEGLGEEAVLAFFIPREITFQNCPSLEKFLIVPLKESPKARLCGQHHKKLAGW